MVETKKAIQEAPLPDIGQEEGGGVDKSEEEEGELNIEDHITLAFQQRGKSTKGTSEFNEQKVRQIVQDESDKLFDILLDLSQELESKPTEKEEIRQVVRDTYDGEVQRLDSEIGQLEQKLTQELVEIKSTKVSTPDVVATLAGLFGIFYGTQFLPAGIGGSALIVLVVYINWRRSKGDTRFIRKYE